MVTNRATIRKTRAKESRNMFAIELIQAYMTIKNYSQDKQVAADLGFDRSMISKIRTGVKKLPDDSAIYIANRCGMDVDEVLIKLQAEKAKTEPEKAAWTNMLKKYKHGINPAISLLISGLLLDFDHTFNFAYCTDMLKTSIKTKPCKTM